MSDMLRLPAPQGKGTNGVDTMIDLYDSEILKIEQVIAQLNAEDVGKRKDIDTFDRKVRELFFKIGFVVDVQCWSSRDGRGNPIPDTFLFDIVIQRRLDERHEFDHDRLVHEITNDILDLGDKGVIHTKKARS